MISERYNFLFFHIPKAAGTSIINSIKENLHKDAIVNEENKPLLEFLNANSVLWPNHASCGNLKEYLGNYVYNNYFKFCFVRNPWDRLVSLYHYTLQKEALKYHNKEKTIPEFTKNILNAGSFENWIRSENIGGSQFDMISNNYDELMVDFVGKSENIQNDFSYICGVIGLENIVLDKSNTSKRGNYKTYYSEETRQIVARHCKKDIEYFKYNFEEDKNLQTLPINSLFVKNNDFGAIRITKLNNSNEWCEIPAHYKNETIMIHPNDIGEAKFEMGFHISNAKKESFSSIQFKACSFDENEQNNGVVLDVVLENNQSIIKTESFNLSPREEQNIQLNFDKLNSCRLSILLRAGNNAASNAFCGTSISAITIG